MSLATRPLHRRLRVLLMTGAGACLAILVSQCRMVEDSVLGPADGLSASASRRSGECISACARAYGDSMKVEAALHVQNTLACEGYLDCMDAEGARHFAAIQRINAGRRRCMDACHHQGGGTGGR